MSLKETEEKAAVEAEAATARLRSGLKNVRSIMRDYKAKLCRKNDGEDRAPEARPLFRFDR